MHPRDVRYGRDVAMLTDLVRCTVLAEDLRQVGSHATESLTLSQGSTPIDLLACSTCTLQKLLDHERRDRERYSLHAGPEGQNAGPECRARMHHPTGGGADGDAEGYQQLTNLTLVWY